MFKHLLSVSGFTLLSRLTGFIRDIFITAILGQNDLSDAYNVATRLPNQFRAIFGEGAFNAAFTPAYSRVLEQGGKQAASHFSAQIFSLLLASQVIMLALAWVLMPQFTYLLASGQICAHRATVAHQLSLSAVHDTGDLLFRPSECA